MTTIGSYSNLTGQAAAKGTVSQPAGAKGSGSAESMGSDSFLKLMVTQLKTQDPFAPVDNQQMVAQMAQFSSVAGISEMNTSLKTIADDMKASRMGDAASWIGRAALLPSTQALPLKDGSYAGAVALPDAAKSVQVSLVDESGATVHSENFGATAKGSLSFNWDGKAADGSAVTGPLRIVVAASGQDKFLDTSTAAWTEVRGVQSPAGGTAAKLVTGLGTFEPADAISLS